MGIYNVFVMVMIPYTAYQIFTIYHQVSLPELDPNPWWAAGSQGKEDLTIRDFKIKIPEQDVLDLGNRLKLPSRLTPPLAGVNFTYGFNTDTLKTFISHWKTKYNWREREEKLNKLNHYKTKIEGLDIHFIRVKPKVDSGVTVRPLLLCHGWPSSFVEFIDIIPLLTSPQKGTNIVFEVIIPSIPGYGFSDPSTKPGLGVPQTAQIYHKLMKRLGFNKFYVHGGDWGSLIGSTMGTLYPDDLFGMHLTTIIQNTPIAILKYILGAFLPSGLIMESINEKYLYPINYYVGHILQETGYMHIQITKPDTVGIALSSSPVGLAAYILEKFSTLTNRNGPKMLDGGLNNKFPINMNKLLDNINIYWFTQTITTSMRYYAELPNYLSLKLEQLPSMVPTGLAYFPNGVSISPKSFVTEKFHNLLSYTIHESGGHFIAMEAPKVLADDIHQFTTLVEKQ